MLRFFIKVFFIIMLLTISTVSNSKNVVADDIESFASKLFNHYEYDDKITNYLKSFFSFDDDDVKSSSINAINNPGIISPSIHCLTIVSEHFTISGCAFPS